MIWLDWQEEAENNQAHLCKLHGISSLCVYGDRDNWLQDLAETPFISLVSSSAISDLATEDLERQRSWQEEGTDYFFFYLCFQQTSTTMKAWKKKARRCLASFQGKKRLGKYLEYVEKAEKTVLEDDFVLRLEDFNTPSKRQTSEDNMTSWIQHFLHILRYSSEPRHLSSPEYKNSQLFVFMLCQGANIVLTCFPPRKSRLIAVSAVFIHWFFELQVTIPLNSIESVSIDWMSSHLKALKLHIFYTHSCQMSLSGCLSSAYCAAETLKDGLS